MPSRKPVEKNPGRRVASPRRLSQRPRLVAGMVAASGRDGYAGASVSAVIANAGVSRPTFYDYFEDRDACFRASIEDVGEQLLEEATAALAGRSPQEAADALVEALLSYAAAQPARARFLMGDAMSGGPAALRARDEGVARLAAAVDLAQRALEPAAPAPDIDPRVLVGTLYRMIAARLRRGETAVQRLGEELLGWLRCYERPSAQRRWRVLAPRRIPGSPPAVPRLAINRMPRALGPGRPRIAEAQVAENQRLRVLHAIARLAGERGYAATTVADVTRLASVDGRVFYRLFSDKQQAFQAVQELAFQEIMDVTAKAFFAARGWPERSWQAARAMTAFLQQNLLAARVGFVDAYAAGPAAVQRIEDSQAAFMFFLQEGLAMRPRERPPSRVAMEAIVAAVFEIVYLQARRVKRVQIASMLPDVAHLWLTPFLGGEAADALIDERLERGA